MPPKTEKPQADRVRECLVILKKLTEEVGVPADNPSIVVLKRRMGDYWRTGDLCEDSLPLVGSNRSIVYRFPRWSHQFVEVTLRVNKVGVQESAYPPDLLAEINKGCDSDEHSNSI